MPEISVIIPVHNAGRYLPECIESLLGQTCSDMEFIFVDDASQDDSARVLMDWQKRDERIRVLSFPENRGVSAARNAGIEAARGRYIGFCDADDWVEPEMFEALLSACRKTDSQASFCRVFKDRPGGQENVPLGFPDGTVFDTDTIRTELIPAMLALPEDGDGQPLSGYSPRNLFARCVLEGIRFREDIRYAEDLLFIVTAYLKATHVTAVDRAWYHYRFHENSVTKHYSKFVPDSLDKSNDALEKLLSGLPECRRRMAIRRRKTAVDAVRNCCAAQTPFSFMERVHWTRAYMKRPKVRTLFRDLSLKGLGTRVRIRLGLMKYRLAFLSAFLYSTVFKYRV
ncbi:MAG: glycosyltransferase family 2 protein [Clostridia bacterium]|nr:glycosyltransferase family 2 protein [Clostridia bacterium]